MKKLPLILVAQLLLWLSPVSAQSTSPTLATLVTDNPGRLLLAPVMREKLQEEDAARDGKPGLPLRYGVVQTVVGVSLDRETSNGGRWSTLPDGREQWTLQVASDGASSLEFVFSQLRLPATAELRLISLSGKSDEIRLTDADNPRGGRYFSRLLMGAEARLELTLTPAIIRIR
jgi:hypothetical protein